MSETSWWAGKVQPAVPEYAPASGEAYRAERAWNSTIYRTPEFAGVQKVSEKATIYVDSPAYEGLGSYAGKPVTSPLRRNGKGKESAMAYKMRAEKQIRPGLEELAAELRDAIEVDYAAALAELDGKTYGAREHAEQGLFGTDTAANAKAWSERQAAENEAKYGWSEYQAVNPEAAALNRLAANRLAEEQARGAAVAARYAHGNLRPSGAGLNVTTSR